MLVRSRMTAGVLTVAPLTSLGEALRITREHAIRHLPVVDKGTLVGLVSDRDLRLAAPPIWASDTDYATLRATFEQKTVADVMTHHAIISTSEDTPIEDAASLMYEHRIGCLPVMRDTELVGILTETDVMRSFVELFGTSESSRRIEVLIPNRPGELSRVVRAIGVDFKINISGMVMPPIAEGDDALVIAHVQARNVEELVNHLRQIGYKVGSPSLDLEPEASHRREPQRVRHWAADGF
ncbi:MAG: CBS and ACT domain-containing protein [Gemmatimonadota bacterium]